MDLDILYTLGKGGTQSKKAYVSVNTQYTFLHFAFCKY